MTDICFGMPEATEEQIIAAAKAARCHDFIMALPDGYDTVVGEGAVPSLVVKNSESPLRGPC